MDRGPAQIVLSELRPSALAKEEQATVNVKDPLRSIPRRPSLGEQAAYSESGSRQSDQAAGGQSGFKQ